MRITRLHASPCRPGLPRQLRAGDRRPTDHAPGLCAWGRRARRHVRLPARREPGPRRPPRALGWRRCRHAPAVRSAGLARVGNWQFYAFACLAHHAVDLCSSEPERVVVVEQAAHVCWCTAAMRVADHTDVDHIHEKAWASDMLAMHLPITCESGTAISYWIPVTGERTAALRRLLGCRGACMRAVLAGRTD